MRWLFLALVFVLTTACATTLKRPATLDGEMIEVRYEPGGPICFPCSSMEVLMTSDGKAMWVHGRGTYKEWIEERHLIPFTPEHFRKWKRYLERYRPAKSTHYGADSEEKTCDEAYFDVPSRGIKWTDAKGETYLGLDLGCDPEKHRELTKFFDEFPGMMGIPTPQNSNDWVAASPQQR